METSFGSIKVSDLGGRTRPQQNNRDDNPSEYQFGKNEYKQSGAAMDYT